MNEINVIHLFLQMRVRTPHLCKIMASKWQSHHLNSIVFFFLFRFKRPLEKRKMGPISKKFDHKNVKSCKIFFFKFKHTSRE